MMRQTEIILDVFKNVIGKIKGGDGGKSEILSGV